MKSRALYAQLLREAVEKRFAAQAALDAITKKYTALGMSCWISIKGDYGLEVSSIKVVDKTQRKQGTGTRLMEELMDLCDEYDLIAALTPSDTESSMAGLMRFYKRFGFGSNMGRRKDFRFRNTLIRYPQTLAAA